MKNFAWLDSVFFVLYDDDDVLFSFHHFTQSQRIDCRFVDDDDCGGGGGGDVGAKEKSVFHPTILSIGLCELISAKQYYDVPRKKKKIKSTTILDWIFSTFLPKTKSSS